MKLTITRRVEIEATAIRCTVPFDDDDEIADDFPGRGGARIVLTLDLDRRAIRDWPAGRCETLHLKVRDEGVYELLDQDGRNLASAQDCYVLRCLPQEYGDYLIAEIGPDGVIAGWAPREADVADAFDDEGR